MVTVAVGMTIADRPPHRSVQARLRIRLLTKDAWAAAPARGENPQLDRTQFGNASPLKERSLRPAQRGNKPGRVESENLQRPVGPLRDGKHAWICAEQGPLRVD